MKFKSLFHLVEDAKDLLDYLEGVGNRDQLVSRLERLKREGADDLLACVEGLRASVTDALDDTLEMSAALDDEDVSDNIDEEITLLESQIDEAGKSEEDPISPATDEGEKVKIVEPAS